MLRFEFTFKEIFQKQISIVSHSMFTKKTESLQTVEYMWHIVCNIFIREIYILVFYDISVVEEKDLWILFAKYNGLRQPNMANNGGGQATFGKSGKDNGKMDV